MKMDRHIGLNFGIPAASAKIMSIMTRLISLTLNNRVLQRALTKFTKCEGGIPHLGSNKGELWLHHSASSNGVVATSVFWLFPQQMLLGLCEMFGVVGLLEFYNQEFSEKMRSIGNSLPYLCLAGVTHLSTVAVCILRSVTGRHGQPNWLDNDINAGLGYFLPFCLVKLSREYF
ncbi:hypothetical protein ACFX13_011652 [Malus domestica]